jgi:hypothetical protein
MMLDSHPELAIPYESYFFVDYFRQGHQLTERLASADGRAEVMASILNGEYVRRWDWTPKLEDMNLERCTALSACIEELYSAYAGHFGKARWGDKTPRYIIHIDVLNKLFPQSRFIHVIRDGRDVALSLMRQWFGPDGFCSALRFWKENLVIGRKMLAMLPEERVLEVRLEELAMSPATTLKSVCEFAELTYDISLLDSYRQRAAEKLNTRMGNLHAGLAEAPSVARATRWPTVLSRADQALAWEIVGGLLGELGYPAGASTHPLKPYRKLYHYAREAVVWRWHRYGEKRTS